MDVQVQGRGSGTGQDRPKSLDSHENHITQPNHVTQHVHVTQPVPDGPAGDHRGVPSAESRCPGGMDHGGSDESLTDMVSSNENSLLLPNHTPVIPHKLENEAPPSETPSPQSVHALPEGVANVAPPICTPPPACKGPGGRRSPELPKSNGHSHPNKKHLPSTTKSQQSFKANATQIQQVAGDDCCVHCVLACLFCEVLSLCSVLTQCLSCRQGCEALCCCGEAASGGVACCGGDACSAILECEILEDCCQSSDCLEICLECCSICFPT